MKSKGMLALMMGAIIASSGVSQVTVQVYADDRESISISESMEDALDAEFLKRLPNTEGEKVRWVYEGDQVFKQEILDNIYVSPRSGLVFKPISDSEVELVLYENNDEENGEEVIEIPQDVIIEGKRYTVTSIGDSVFSYNDNITDVILPESITKIGASAFVGCRGLWSIKLPESLTEISYGAFEGCYNLNLTELPENITKIDESAFENCWHISLEELPANLTEISAYTFRNCVLLQLIELPEGVNKIGAAAFECCRSLKLTELPESLTEIGLCAFMGCSTLELTELPENLCVVGVRAFKFANIRTITIPKSVTSLEFGAFDTDLLKKIMLEEGSVLNIKDIQRACGSQYNRLVRDTEDEESLGELSFSEQFDWGYNYDHACNHHRSIVW